jgi:hypothetical protein
MAFGSTVANLVQNAIGSAGYIVKINTADLLAEKIEAVQAQAGPSSTPEPVEGSTSIAGLYEYLNDSDCPDLAYNYSDGECSIFFKTTVFAYSATTRYALFGKRKAQNCTSDADLLDIPDRDINLLAAYCLGTAYALKKGGTPKFVKDTIKNAEQEIRNE